MTFSNILGGLGGGGGIGGIGGGDTIGRGLVRLGADVSSMRPSVKAGMDGLNQEVAAGAQRAQQTSSRFWNTALGVVKAGAIATGAGVVTALGMAASASINYEQAFAGVIKTVDAAPEVLDRLRGRFREMAKEIPLSAEEFARLGEAAGALGVAADDIEEFARVTALIGVTTDVSSDQAAVSLGQLGNVLELTSADYERFGSTLVDLGNKGASTESQILEIASRSGAMGKQVGLTTPVILAFASAVANLGIEVEAGGSALQYLYSSLSAIMADEQKLGILADTVGMTGDQFRIAFQEDAQGAIISFLRALGELDATGQAVLLDELGLAGVRTSRAYIGLAESVDRNLLPAIDNANAAWEENNALQTEADKRFATTASQITLLKNRVGDLFIELGDRLLPAINTFVSYLADAIPAAAGKVADLWNSTLGPAVSEMWQGISDLATALFNLFNFGDEATDAGGVLETAFEGVGTVLSVIAEYVGKIAGGIASLLESDIGGWVARSLIALGALKVMVDGIVRGTRFLSGLGRGTLRFLSFGTLGGPSAAERAAQEAGGADQGLQFAARDLKAAASSLQGAAAALRGAAATDAAIPGGGGLPIGGAGSTTTAAGSAASRRATQSLGQRLGQFFLGDLASGAGRLVSGGRMLLGAAGSALTLASRLFWPALAASLVLDIAKQPVGDFVANTLKKQNLGAEIARDGILAGLGTWLESVVQGVDVELIAGLNVDAVTASGVTITRAQAARMGLTRSTMEEIFTDEMTFEGLLETIHVAHLNVQNQLSTPTIETPELNVPDLTVDTLPAMTAGLEAEQKWQKQIEDIATSLGIDVSAMWATAIKETGAHDIFDPEVVEYVSNLLVQTERAQYRKDRNFLRDQVSSYLKENFGATDEQLAFLTESDIDFLATAITRNADGSFSDNIQMVLDQVANNLANGTYDFTPPPIDNANPELRFSENTIVPSTTGAQMFAGSGLRDSISGLQRLLDEQLDWEKLLKTDQGEQVLVQKANENIRAYGRAIEAAAKDESLRQPVMDALGVDTWEEALALQKDWLDQNGTTRALELGTAYAAILQEASKQGLDLSEEPWAKDIEELLTGLLDSGTLTPELAAQVEALLNSMEQSALAAVAVPSRERGREHGRKLGGAVGAGLRGNKQELIDAFDETSRPGPQSPRTKTLLESHGRHLITTVSGTVRGDPKIKDALDEAAKPKTLSEALKGALRRMGSSLLTYVNEGITYAPDVADPGLVVAKKITSSPYVYKSPAKKGPLANNWAQKQGHKLMDFINEGVAQREFKIPKAPSIDLNPRDFSLPSSAAARAVEATANLAENGVGGGTVHIDRAYINNAEDEKSLYARTRFLMPRTN